MSVLEAVHAEPAEACPRCGRDGPVLYSGLRDRLWDAPGRWSIRMCPAGHVAWLDPRPIQEDIPKLYRSYYTHPVRAPEGPDRISQRLKDQVFASLGYGEVPSAGSSRVAGFGLRLAPFLRDYYEYWLRYVRGPPSGALLDIGCGDGEYLERMRRWGWEVHGIEPDPAAVDAARGRRGLDVRAGFVEDVPMPEDAFEVITLSHVIEHTRDPEGVLEKCRRLLRPRGICVLLTPNLSSWGHRSFGSAWFHLDPPRHVYLFTPETLRASAVDAGLVPTTVQTTALYAYDVSRMSRAIRRAGRASFLHPPRLGLPDLAFHAAENAMLRVRPDAGEEIVLIAKRGDGR